MAWAILPVVLAGLGHVLVLKLKIVTGLAVPLDGGRRWRGQPLFGENKTWRDVVLMTALTAVFTRVQHGYCRQRRGAVVSVVNDYSASPWLCGAIMGLCYCLAELPNSFAKRRLGIPPGKSTRCGALAQYVVDQTDSVLGCLIGMRSFYHFRRGEAVLAFGLATLIHMAVERLLHAIGVKKHAP